MIDTDVVRILKSDVIYCYCIGYTGDLTIALEPSTDPRTIPEEHQPQGIIVIKKKKKSKK